MYKNRAPVPILILLIFLFASACSTGYIATTVWTQKAGSNFNLPVQTFEISMSDNFSTKYPNHFNQRFLDKFIDSLKDKLIFKGLSVSDNPNIELIITEFDALHTSDVFFIVTGELQSLKIEVYSQGKHLETMTYKSIRGHNPPGVTYFKKMPTIDMASDKIAKKVCQLFNL